MFCKTVKTPMKKRDRAKVVKGLLDEVRSKIVPKNEMQMMRLEYIKRMELRAIDENTDEAVEKIKKYVLKEKNNIMEYPTLRLKSQWINGEFIVTKL